MTAPTPVVRAVVYERDGEQCVSCGVRSPLEFQHRRATGMGGSKTRPLHADGVTACSRCNAAFEADMQTRALASGWKVRRWADPLSVPVFYTVIRRWALLDNAGARRFIPAPFAVEQMRSVYGDAYDEWKEAG